jgi:hypothetical protein
VVAVGEHGFDPTGLELAAQRVGVVASVGEHSRGLPKRRSGPATHRRDPLDQRDELGDVVAVGGGERPGERDPGRVYE